MKPDGAVAAIDPGRNKCGLVCSDPGQQQLALACIVSPEACLDRLRMWQAKGTVSTVVLGDGTSSRHWQRQLEQLGLPVVLVDEWGTTLAARALYWELWPPRGWRRLLPSGLRLPPRDLDDLAAQILLERWLKHKLPRGPGTLGP